MLSMVEYVHQRILTYPSNLIGVDFNMEMDMILHFTRTLSRSLCF